MSPARNATLAALLAAAPLALAALPAAAQSGWNDGAGTVTCSSDDNRRQQCATPFRGRAALVKNLSDTRCVEGRNWGSGNGYIWVDDGCRGRFASASGNGWGGGNDYGNGQTIRCESADNRSRTCRTGWRGAVLVRQLSDTRCVEGRNWGADNGSIWVNDGCRGEFAEGRGGWNSGNGNGRTVRCESADNRNSTCRTGWRGAVLVRQLSDTRCVEGRNWGSGNGSIWVSGGCRGEFAEGRGGWGGDNGRGNGDYSVTCSSDDGRRRTCAWDDRQGRPTVIKQLSDTPCAEGRNWGYYGGTLWVNAGCRARFGAR